MQCVAIQKELLRYELSLSNVLFLDCSQVYAHRLVFCLPIGRDRNIQV